MNYFDGIHILEVIHNEVNKTPRRQLAIDLTTGEIDPEASYCRALVLSAKWYAGNFRSHLTKHQIDPDAITNPRIVAYADLAAIRFQIEADDDRGNEYAIEPSGI